MKRKKNIPTIGTIKIRGGQVLPIPLAKHVCRCADCLGPVGPYNNTLACQANPTGHKGLIHQTQARAEAARREAELDEVAAIYFPQDGQLAAVTDHTPGDPNAH